MHATIGGLCYSAPTGTKESAASLLVKGRLVLARTLISQGADIAAQMLSSACYCRQGVLLLALFYAANWLREVVSAWSPICALASRSAIQSLCSPAATCRICKLLQGHCSSSLLCHLHRAGSVQ